MKQKNVYFLLRFVFVAMLFISLEGCKPTIEPKKEKAKESSLPTPLLKEKASFSEVETFEKSIGGKFLQKDEGEGYVQVTYVSSKAPAIARSYVFKEGALQQAISLWKPYTLVFQEKKETLLTDSFRDVLKQNGYIKPLNQGREYVTYHPEKGVKLILVPATMNVQERDLVAKFIFLFEKYEAPEKSPERPKGVKPFFAQLPLPMCSTPDEILKAEQDRGSKVLMDKREAVAGYFQQEFDVNEEHKGVRVRRRVYLTSSKNNCLQMAGVVLTPQSVYWDNNTQDYDAEIIHLIKKEGFIDTGLDKQGLNHFFYKEEGMKDGRQYTVIMLQRLSKDRYPEIKEPSICINYYRSENMPVNNY